MLRGAEGYRFSLLPRAPDPARRHRTSWGLQCKGSSRGSGRCPPTRSPFSTFGHHEAWYLESLPKGFLSVYLCSSGTQGAPCKGQGLCLLFTLSPKCRPQICLRFLGHMIQTGRLKQTTASWCGLTPPCQYWLTNISNCVPILIWEYLGSRRQRRQISAP